MKRPTPDTDAVAAYEGNWDTKALRMTVHARKLERERDEAREEWGKASIDAAQLLSEKTKVIAERDEARAERDKLQAMRREVVAANKGAKINAQINNSLTAKLAEAKRERDEARDIGERLSKQCLDMMDENRSLKSERDEAREVASGLAKQAKRLRKERDEAIRQRDETNRSSKYACDYNYEQKLKAERERDEAREALMEIEDRCVDCEDACDDLQKIRDIAVKALEGAK